MSTQSTGRQYPDGPLEAPPGWVLPEDWPENSLNFWPEAAGAFLASLLAEPAPGPPYTHTIVPPQEAVFTWSGKLLYRPPDHPAFTMTERRP